MYACVNLCLVCCLVCMCKNVLRNRNYLKDGDKVKEMGCQTVANEIDIEFTTNAGKNYNNVDVLNVLEEKNKRLVSTPINLNLNGNNDQNY